MRASERLDEQTKMVLTRGFDFWLEVERRGSVHEVMLWKKGGSLGRYEDTIKEFRDRMQAWNYAVQEAQKLKIPAMLFDEGKLNQIYDPQAKEQFAFRQSAKRGLRKR